MEDNKYVIDIQKFLDYCDSRGHDEFYYCDPCVCALAQFIKDTFAGAENVSVGGYDYSIGYGAERQNYDIPPILVGLLSGVSSFSILAALIRQELNK